MRMRKPNTIPHVDHQRRDFLVGAAKVGACATSAGVAAVSLQPSSALAAATAKVASPSAGPAANGRAARRSYGLPAAGECKVYPDTGLLQSDIAIPGLTRQQANEIIVAYNTGVYVRKASTGGMYVFAGIGGHTAGEIIDAFGFDWTDLKWRYIVRNEAGLPNLPPPGYRLEDTTGAPRYLVKASGNRLPAPGHAYGYVLATDDGPKGSVLHVISSAIAQGPGSSYGRSEPHLYDLTTGVVSWPSRNRGDQLPEWESAWAKNYDGSAAWDSVTDRYYFMAYGSHGKARLAYFDKKAGAVAVTPAIRGGVPSVYGDAHKSLTVDSGRRLLFCGASKSVLPLLDLTSDETIAQGFHVRPCKLVGDPKGANLGRYYLHDGRWYSIVTSRQDPTNALRMWATRITIPDDWRTGACEVADITDSFGGDPPIATERWQWRINEGHQLTNLGSEYMGVMPSPAQGVMVFNLRGK